MWIFYYFNFERNYDILKSNSPCILLNKIINFNKNGMESKPENPTKEKRGRKRKERTFFVPCILSEGNFFDICILSQCIVY